MTGQLVDAENHDKIAGLGQRVLGGGQISRDEARWLSSISKRPPIF